ncbi:H(+) hexose cotransporter 2 [Micractinium conductrix]|uniref:H(+) hexose cotransporter 2 n=1 Tax=Micractinium conductrix TaxID=554055 RepID=A0A2P6VLC9_9CHLO|nr:H(+) hexose cotransporter 2 [Micractinium conductrix]|eukprot:PSC74912.1 H(+) hexose cotransporter 2 [Micractinium conductrix]
MAGGGPVLTRASVLHLADYESELICTYNDQKLQVFTSSLFLAGMFSSLFAGHLTRHFGRKITMIVAACWFLARAGLNAGAHELWMLVVGRIFLGFEIGMANQVVPLYLSEMAPYKYRGGLNMMFQLAATLGILIAQLINYGVQDKDHGWRLSLGLAAVPAGILLLGGIMLPESPNSLIERGHLERGRDVLRKLRGSDKIDAEFNDIQEASANAGNIRLRDSWRTMFTTTYSPMLIVTCMIAMLQQLTGINAIMFYVPVIFNSLGSGKSASLLNTVIIGAVNVVATFVSILSVDKFGRRFLFLEGGIQMLCALVVTGVVLATKFTAEGVLPSSVAIGVLVVICVFVAGFAWIIDCEETKTASRKAAQLEASGGAPYPAEPAAPVVTAAKV